MIRRTLLSFLIFFCVTAIINAQTIFYVTPTGAGNQTGSSWSNAFSDLQSAIDSAYLSGGGQVWVAKGIYHPGTNRSDHYVMKNNVEIYGGFTGSETHLFQRNWQNNLTTLSGDIGVIGDSTDNICRLINNAYSQSAKLDTTAILDGFIIRDGCANNPNALMQNVCSGIYNEYASPGIYNCTFKNNYAEWTSVMQNKFSAPYLENCIFEKNSCVEYGAIFNYNSNCRVEGCIFIENNSYNPGCGGFGGVFFNGYSICTIDNSSFSRNFSTCKGGCIFNEFGNLNVNNCTFDNNYSLSGGSIHIMDSSEANIQNCSFLEDSTGGNGGSINCIGSSIQVFNTSFNNCVSDFGSGGAISIGYSKSDITNCSFIGCKAHGGALFIRDDNSSTYIRNCLLVRNLARNSIAGAAINLINANPIIINSTISNNHSMHASGGIECIWGSSPELINCILYGNTGMYPEQIVIHDSSCKPSLRYCINQTNTIGAINNIQYVLHHAYYQNNIDIDPSFVNTTIDDYHLQLNSYAINAGLADTSGLNLPLSDLDGNIRIIDRIVDMGCYEYGSSPIGTMPPPSKSDFILSPNPTQDMVYVDTNVDIESYFVYSASGELICEGNTFGLKDKGINLSSYPAGIYLIKLVAKNATFSVKVIKK